jgi:hypothetical protein
MKYDNISVACLDSNSPELILSIENLINNAPTIMQADINPNLPMSFAIASNFYYKGVASSSYLIFSLILPIQLYSPTTMTNILPDPS